ncbi:NAD-dependent epimerase/dehydratase family protein [Stigmatella hybrida]|uniref:NAD-dependent epimerase/dehydratase family protein n=1 Tax=Stigmatella hybrida TaxID=394097 RepID=UPI001CDA7EB5
MFEAAHRAGVKRVVFASSVQAVGFHPLEKTIDETARLRPSGYYGVSKAFGEALASLYADKYGLSLACVRVALFETNARGQLPRGLARIQPPLGCRGLSRRHPPERRAPGSPRGKDARRRRLRCGLLGQYREDPARSMNAWGTAEP